MKAELVELAEDNVTPPPEAVKVPDCVCVIPTVTLPKLIDPGVTPNVPLTLVPLPVKETPTDGSDALEASESVALLVPLAEGAKVTERLALPPAGKVWGKVRPLALNPLPLTVAPEIVRLDPPELEMVRACVWLLPTATLPRFILPGAVR